MLVLSPFWALLSLVLWLDDIGLYVDCVIV